MDDRLHAVERSIRPVAQALAGREISADDAMQQTWLRALQHGACVEDAGAGRNDPADTRLVRRTEKRLRLLARLR